MYVHIRIELFLVVGGQGGAGNAAVLLGSRNQKAPIGEFSVEQSERGGIDRSSSHRKNRLEVLQKGSLGAIVGQPGRTWRYRRNQNTLV